MLCTLLKGWFGTDLKEFMLQQPQTEVVEWNQVKYYPDGTNSMQAGKAQGGKPKRKRKGKGKGSKVHDGRATGKSKGGAKPQQRAAPKSEL